LAIKEDPAGGSDTYSSLRFNSQPDTYSRGRKPSRT
jgi:hypothetical protein